MFRSLFRFLFIFVFLILMAGLSHHQNGLNFYELGSPRDDHLIHVSIDEEFSSEQIELVKKAFNTWEVASSNKIKFDLSWNKTKPGRYLTLEDPVKNAGIFFWYLPRDHSYLTNDKIRAWKSYLGLMVYGEGENSGNIIIFNDVEPFKFYTVALHEVGHLIGMKHSSEPFWAVMHPQALVDCITLLDAKQLCELYDCTPKPECSPTEDY